MTAPAFLCRCRTSSCARLRRRALPPAGEYGVGCRVPAARRGSGRRHQDSHRRHRRGGRPDAGWLARGADRRRPGGTERRRGRTDLRAAVHRAGVDHHGRGRPGAVRAQAVCHPETDRKRRGRAVDRRRPEEAVLRLHAVQQDARLQGDAERRPARSDVPRPAAIRTSSRRSRSCTSASAPTRSPPGRWRTHSASSRTTARSTRSPGTSTGCAPARGCSSRACSATTCASSFR